MGVFLNVLEKTIDWEYTSFKGDPIQTGNLHSGHFGDTYFEQLPNGFRGVGFRA